MKYLFLLLLAGCVSQRYVPDKQIQLTLIRAYREDKTNACGIPRNPDVYGRTWHCELLKDNGDTLRHHYFTASHTNTQRWLVPGDKYTLEYKSQDSIHCAFPYIYAKLKWNK